MYRLNTFEVYTQVIIKYSNICQTCNFNCNKIKYTRLRTFVFAQLCSASTVSDGDKMTEINMGI